jgi:hypothetical protein
MKTFYLGRSVYNVPIEKELGLPAGTAANTFYIAVGFFGFRYDVTTTLAKHASILYKSVQGPKTVDVGPQTRSA